MDRTRLKENAAALGAELTDEQTLLLEQFCEKVATTNTLFNLTAIKDPEEMEEKNALDCATVLPLLPDTGSYADVGTGAGFPGVVVALCKPQLEVSLIEATNKKLEFACGAAAELGRQVTGIHMRSEEAARTGLRESFDAVSARAVAALPVLLEYTLPLVKTGGILVAMKGQGADEELRASEKALKELRGEVLAVRRFSLPTAGERALIVIRKTGKCPEKYPRPAGAIRKKPL